MSRNAHHFPRIDRSLIRIAVLFSSFFFFTLNAQDDLKYNAYGMKKYTLETEHFRLSYTPGLEQVAKEAGEQFEKLHTLYRETYNISLPDKTEILVIDGELTNGFAFTNLNFIVIWCHDLDWNLRGTHDWLKGVCTHEFGHIVSLWSSMKFPSWMPYLQWGYFTHPNEPNRIEALHVFPSITIPPWLAEGIAQYEDSRHGTDSWDTHRDMIMRTLSISNQLLSWEHMSVMTGRGDDFEKTYNHGFSLVKYIANHYGYAKIVSLLRENALVYRLGFDGSVKAILGISAQKLYADWKDSLNGYYSLQVKNLGRQIYGRKINKEGYDNFWPKFSPHDKKIYFLSNGEEDYSFSRKILYSYSLVDTVKDENKIKPEKGINGFYSIHGASGLIAYTSMKSAKSVVAPKEGGDRAFDVFIDTLPPEKRKFSLFKKKTERQVTEKKRVFTAVFSPSGDMLACAHRIHDRFYLAFVDTSGKNFRIVYPDSFPQSTIAYIYSLDWSGDGRHIAISYIDSKNRKIGIYDTLTHAFSVIANDNRDDRDPRFGPNGKNLYFSSDKTGIFNIYRYNQEQRLLQRLTNVSGGAFTPDISSDEKKLVFSNYDETGFGIYLIDTLRVVEELRADSLIMQRNPLPVHRITATFSSSRPYSRMPRQLLVYPTFITEQILTSTKDPFRGQGALETGVIAELFDPFALLETGTDLRGYFLFEPTKLFDLFSFKHFFNPLMTYDLGFFGTTKLLPLPISLNYTQRQIPGSDFFYDETYESNRVLNYSITLRNIDAIVSHTIAEACTLNYIAGYNWYDVYLSLEDYYGFDQPYNLAKGSRVGAFLTYLAPEVDSRMLISPRGAYAKLKYYYRSQKLADDEQTFSVDTSTGQIVVNYGTYNYHDMSLSVKYGMTSPWHSKHDLYFEFNGNAVMTNKELRDRLEGKKTYNEPSIPSYYQPVEWLPGYTYYCKYKDLKVPGPDSLRDTVVITGNAVAQAEVSYRFPLWPRSLDTRLWFLYFDKLYGAVNFCAAAGWKSLSDIRTFRKENWLSSAGAELRLEALSFSDYPMAIKLRWDRGLNRDAPVGGDRFTLGIGFSFDNWEYINDPDYGAVKYSRPRNR